MSSYLPLTLRTDAPLLHKQWLHGTFSAMAERLVLSHSTHEMWKFRVVLFPSSRLLNTDYMSSASLPSFTAIYMFNVCAGQYFNSV